jgi:DNA-binding HxlR family transcriptional regulator
MTDIFRSHRSTCPISAALEVLGDRWSLLIVRDMMFGGARTYTDFLASDEGIATNILANRLSKLQASGIITGARDPRDGRSLVYRLTAKGIDLAPVLMELSAWGTRHEEGQPPSGILDAWKADRQRFLDDVGNSLTGRKGR